MQGGEDKEVNMTYEVLFDILRNEKNRPELQKLSKTFFQDLVKYLNEKREIADNTSKTGIFAMEEREKTLNQLKNIKKILKELYAKREKKIIELALDSSYLGSGVDITAILEEEKIMFEQLVRLFDKCRNNIIHKLLAGELPSFDVEPYNLKENRSIGGGAKEKERHILGTPSEERQIVEQAAGGESSSLQEMPKEETKMTKMVRFIYAVPRFIGKELETYGPFEEEDVTTLPAEIADIIIAKGRAEEIKQE